MTLDICVMAPDIYVMMLHICVMMPVIGVMATDIGVMALDHVEARRHFTYMVIHLNEGSVWLAPTSFPVAS